jgi:hypothetical protein
MLDADTDSLVITRQIFAADEDPAVIAMLAEST